MSDESPPPTPDQAPDPLAPADQAPAAEPGARARPKPIRPPPARSPTVPSSGRAPRGFHVLVGVLLTWIGICSTVGTIAVLQSRPGSPPRFEYMRYLADEEEVFDAIEKSTGEGWELTQIVRNFYTESGRGSPLYDYEVWFRRPWRPEKPGKR